MSATFVYTKRVSVLIGSCLMVAYTHGFIYEQIIQSTRWLCSDLQSQSFCSGKHEGKEMEWTPVQQYGEAQQSHVRRINSCSEPKLCCIMSQPLEKLFVCIQQQAKSGRGGGVWRGKYTGTIVWRKVGTKLTAFNKYKMMRCTYAMHRIVIYGSSAYRIHLNIECMGPHQHQSWSF